MVLINLSYHNNNNKNNYYNNHHSNHKIKCKLPISRCHHNNKSKISNNNSNSLSFKTWEGHSQDSKLLLSFHKLVSLNSNNHRLSYLFSNNKRKANNLPNNGINLKGHNNNSNSSPNSGIIRTNSSRKSLILIIKDKVTNRDKETILLNNSYKDIISKDIKTNQEKGK